jgi:cell division protease FtsH
MAKNPPTSPDRRSPAPEGENTPEWRVSPAADGRGRQTDDKQPLIPSGRWFWYLLGGLLLFNLLVAFATAGAAGRQRVPYQPFFVNQLQAGNVKSISSLQDTVEGQLKHAVRYPPPGQSQAVQVTNFKTEIPTFIDPATVTRMVSSKDVIVNAKAQDTGRAFWANLVLGVLPTLLFMGLLIYGFRQYSSGSGVMGRFGKSTARRVDQSQLNRVTFDDVAGIDEAKQELQEIVDFLKRPERYHKLGAKIPHGVLLYGQPGTGKTLLARATAGEANAAFFTMSASEFVEAIVGMGASRVRDLFKQAKEAAPSIVFIDELDAIGRSRSSGAYSGSNDEREQTLNQILTEMDGFEPDTNVIVLGATNRPEVLDDALLRPGRFDRRIAVQTPDKPGRLAILRIHTREVPLADDVDLEQIAASTPGATGADLALIVNEAALFAARRGHPRVAQQDLTDAIEKTQLGSERQVVMTDEDRERTAYHESGHALVGMLTPGADPVRKISIIPRGQALGVTLSTPEGDRYSYTREDLVAKIKVSLGGRAAEKVVFDEITTGPESDIQQLTKIARGMVARWGMSDAIGPLAIGDGREDAGSLTPGGSPASPATQQAVDEEARRIVEDAEREVMDLLERERPRLDALAHALLRRETLDQPEAYRVAGVGPAVDSDANGKGGLPAGVAAGA